MDRAAPVWKVVSKVYLFFERFITLPINFDKERGLFYVTKHGFHTKHRFQYSPFRFGCLCVLAFTLRILYKLFVQIVSPESNRHLQFGMEGVLLYTIGLLICMEALFCFWTDEFKADPLVSVVNLLFKLSKKRSSLYVESSITLFGYICLDVGEAVAVVATIGFLAFPGIAGLVPLVMEHDPATHMMKILMPNTNHILLRSLFAGLVQGSVAAFGAIVCLQILLIFVLIVYGFSEMINRALVDDERGRKVNLFKNSTYIINNANKEKKPSLLNIARDIRYNFEKEGLNFRPNLLIHRQLTIMQHISSDALEIYTPGLVFIGMCLVISTLFFCIRFDLPLAVSLPNTVIAFSVSCIMVGLMPVAGKVDQASLGFKQFWSVRLHSRLARMMLRSYPGDTIQFLWGWKFDTGATITIIASVGFLAFPAITTALPLVVRSVPAMHIAMQLLPNSSVITQQIFASAVTGLVTAFGAMTSLQLLLLLTGIVIEFCGMLHDATKIHNPWLALQFHKVKKVHNHVKKWKNAVNVKGVPQDHGKTKNPFNMVNMVVPVEDIATKTVLDIRKKRQIALRWNAAVHKTTIFRKSLIIYREIYILNTILADALFFYNPVLLLVGISLVVTNIFVPIRFPTLPIVIRGLTSVIAVTVIGIIIFLLPTGSLVLRASKKFYMFWKRRLRTSLNRKQLRSCRVLAIWIGPFCYYHEGTLLIVINIIFTYLGTLLINF
ncbi:unnamed protein product [Orchesella dallaii]|uniref:Uncharacterized protein n=1 Tax=Orchesella dallaii TaxID=48710 RepID=A0ABP1PPF3_9HEXA